MLNDQAPAEGARADMDRMLGKRAEGSYVDQKGTLGTQAELDVLRGFRLLTRAVVFNNYEKGWRAPSTPPGQRRSISELIALLHSEVTEAFEAYRNKEAPLWYDYSAYIELDEQAEELKSTPMTALADGSVVLGKPQGIASELADVIIRVLDMAEEHDLPLIQAVLDKHRYNQTRPYRHGGKAV